MSTTTFRFQSTVSSRPNPPGVLRLAAAACAVCASLLTGCGSDCVTLCEESVEEGCLSAATDCDAICAIGDRFASKTGCEDEREAGLDCQASGTACSAATRCAAEFDALSACTVDYCNANPTDPDCP